MYYVSYGSNMNLFQMSYRCPTAKVIGNGKIKGWKLVFNIHLDIVKSSKKDFVPVVVWDIESENEWNNLDMYEGYPKYYVKRIVKVVLDNGKRIRAVVYVMADDCKGICPPFKQYFETCLDGYLDNNINTEPLYDALEYSVYNETSHNQYTNKPKKKKRKAV